MKSFFKKLAFVMALAMVVSMVAPAGSALAATTGVSLQGTKTIVETYELEKDATVDFSFQGAPKDWKTTFKWASSNEAVATVDQAGVVTAVAAGTATITITAGADASYAETVVVTVKGAEVVPAFTAKQTNTTKVELTFAEGTDMSKATVDDFAVTAIDETFEYTLFANSVAAKKNVVTLEFVDGVLSDGAVIKIAYGDAETTLVASNSEAVSASIHYGMNKYVLAGDAYVYTDLDPDYVYLAYSLYDKNGVDVTANYEVSDFDNLEWSIANGEDIAYIDYDGDAEMDVVCFEEKGVATVKLDITFVDEDGNDRVVSTVAPIVAKNRPAIAFDFVQAGLFDPTVRAYENVIAAVSSFNDADGTVWTTGKTASSIVKDGTAWFGAVLKDNRDRDLVSTVLDHEWASGNVITGTTEYGDYGYFTYTTSNDNVVDIDEDGTLTAIGTGSATILVSFVAYDEDGDELPAKKIGSKRISVYANSYPASYSLTADTTTVTTAGAASKNSVYLQVFDQFGNAMDAWSDWAGNFDVLEDAITIEAVSENYETITGEFVPNRDDNGDGVVDGGVVPVWHQATGWTPAYMITFDGADFNELVKAGKYGTFKFDVTLDKEVEDFEKVSTKTDRAFVKVYNVDAYYADLVEYFDGDAVMPDINVNYNVTLNKSAIDVWTDVRSEFGNPDSAGDNLVKTASMKVELLSSNGLKLMNLPQAYFKELPKGADGKYIETKDLTNPTAGAIYYTISYATKAKNNVEVTTGAAINFAFNKVGSYVAKADIENAIPYTTNDGGQTFEPAGAGWTVTLEHKMVDGEEKLVFKHTSGWLEVEAYDGADDAYLVLNGWTPVAAADAELEDATEYVAGLALADTGNYTVTFYYVNNRNKLAKLDTKTINVSNSMDKVSYEGFVDGNVFEEGTGVITSGNIAYVVSELCDFEWNGITYHDPYGRTDFEIVAVRGDDGDGKFRVREIDFALPAYYNEVAANGGVTYDAEEYIFTLKKNITIYDGE